MGPSAALLVVPDDIIGAVDALGIVHGLLQRFAFDHPVHGGPQHAAGVHRVHIVHIAHHGFGTACQQAVCHSGVHMAVLAVELAGLAEHDAIAPVCTAEEIAVDGIHAVHLDHTVGQQVETIAQVAPEI